jgi:hypothetical protein
MVRRVERLTYPQRVPHLVRRRRHGENGILKKSFATFLGNPQISRRRCAPGAPPVEQRR